MPTDLPGKFDAEQKRILALTLVPLFMSLLSVSIVNVVLPAVQESIHAGSSELQWVLSGYALAFGVLLVAAGRAPGHSACWSSSSCPSSSPSVPAR